MTSRDEWQTPAWLFNILNAQYGFTFDCCANEENRKCERYSSDFLNVVERDVANDVCWMNPPFSKAYEMFQHFFEVCKRGVAIYRCDNMETKVWQDVIFPHATWIFIPATRIQYEGLQGKGVRFPSALIGYNVNPPRGIDGVLIKQIVTIREVI